MSLPKYDELYMPFLRAIADGKKHSKKDVRERIVRELKLSEAELQERLPSGKQPVIDNRIGWTSTYLKKAGLITSPSRAVYLITEMGKSCLKEGQTVNNDYLERYPSFAEFIATGRRTRERNEEKTPSEPQQSPEELLENSFAQINAKLADEVLEEVMKLTPHEFEKLVLKLLLKMGYGSGIEDSGWVTPPSNDEGIDGIIKEDQLGFSSIYIQAKQWDPKRTIDRPEIQKFAGALQGQQAQKGLFIRTASFTQGAKNYVDKINSTIVLIDGSQLTRLMIRHNLGVSVTSVYEIKRIDSDFFIDIQES